MEAKGQGHSNKIIVISYSRSHEQIHFNANEFLYSYTSLHSAFYEAWLHADSKHSKFFEILLLTF